MPKKLISAMLMLALLCSSLAIPQEFHLTASADTGTWSDCSGEGNNKTYTYADFSPFDPNQEGNGTGTESKPYTINTAAQLAALAILVNNTGSKVTGYKYQDGKPNNTITLDGSNFQNTFIKLNTDIDLGEHQWVPIGFGDTIPFKGNFDGQGHEIKNMRIGTDENNPATTYKYAGLFGYVQADNNKTVTIQNVNIGKNSWVYSKKDSVYTYAGGICAKAYADVSANAATITISNCCNSGSVTATSNRAAYAGGICAYADASANTATITISNCCNSGNITASSSSSYAGGICAHADAYANAATITISNCCNSGNITASSSSSYAGGICAKAYANATITISNCYNSGSVIANSTSGTANAGGICAQAEAFADVTISNCYYLNSSTNNGVGKTTGNVTKTTTALPADQMKAAADKTNGSGWKEIKVTYTDSNGSTDTISGNIALVDALNAWVDKNNNAKNSAFTAVTWQTADNNSIYPVLMIFPYVSFQTTLGYEIQSGYYTNQDKVNSSTPTLEKLRDNNNKITDSNSQINWSKSIDGINLYKENTKTPELNIITAQYKVGESPVEVKSDTNQIVEVVDNRTLYVGVFQTKTDEGVTESDKVVGINPKSKDNFLCWVGNVDNDEDLEVLSYRDNYFFSARSDRTIIAVYADDKIAQSITALNGKKADYVDVCTNIESVTKITEDVHEGQKGFKVLSMSSVPDDYTVEYVGFLATKYDDKKNATIVDSLNDTDNPIKKTLYNGTVHVLAQKCSGKEHNVQLSWSSNISGDTSKPRFLRSFIQYKKDDGNSQIKHSDEIVQITLEGDTLDWTSTPATEGGTVQ